MVQEHFWGHDKPRDWAFPGGAREEGESDFDAASRELYEETKLSLKGDIEPLTRFGDFQLYGARLDEDSEKQIWNHVTKRGGYHNEGVGGEKIQVTLVNPDQMSIKVHKSYVQKAFHSKTWLPLEFQGQLEKVKSLVL